MRRRSFLRNSVFSAAGIGMSKIGTGFQTVAKDPPKAEKRTILAWSHSYLDFQGDDTSVRREFERARDSGIELLLLFVHSVPRENDAWYNTTLPGFFVEDRLTRLQRISKETELGADGICIFHFNALKDADFAALKEFKKNLA